MKYYSKNIYKFLLTINIVFGAISLLYLWFAYGWFGSIHNLLFAGEGFIFNLLTYLVPLIFFIFSTVIIIFQQKIGKKFGYLDLILVAVALFHFVYIQISWNVLEILFFLAYLIPFYVVGRLVKEDFLGRKQFWTKITNQILSTGCACGFLSGIIKEFIK